MGQIQTITLLLMLWLVTVETVPSLGSVPFVHYTVMHEVTRSAIVWIFNCCQSTKSTPTDHLQLTSGEKRKQLQLIASALIIYVDIKIGNSNPEKIKLNASTGIVYRPMLM
jgi:hypothetical protein